MTDGIYRIIPTYVGSTIRKRRDQTQAPNHSHVCGINSPVPSASASTIESFPRMWDQPAADDADSFADRIIPTYVGSTISSLATAVLISNHSHVCGINPSNASIVHFVIESFPRMWDQRGGFPSIKDMCRIIPTYVGSTYKRHLID